LEDLPADIAAKNSAWSIAGCVDGPDEPTDYQEIMKHVLDFFLRHDPRTFQSPESRFGWLQPQLHATDVAAC
jgi:hypothetical protein